MWTTVSSIIHRTYGAVMIETGSRLEWATNVWIVLVAVLECFFFTFVAFFGPLCCSINYLVVPSWAKYIAITFAYTYGSVCVSFYMISNEVICTIFTYQKKKQFNFKMYESASNSHVMNLIFNFHIMPPISIQSISTKRSTTFTLFL